MDWTSEQETARTSEPWPALPLAAWKSTCQTLHMWTQIVGKTRLTLTPPLNHWWHSGLYVTARGLTTSPIPYGDRVFEVRFDFVEHALTIETGEGRRRSLPLIPRSVATFYSEYLEMMRSLDLSVHIWRMPSEVPNAIPFDEDTRHAAYDPEWVTRFFRVVSQVDEIQKELMSRFVGKQSPPLFFWGGFDLAQTRFSGRRAPEPVSTDRLEREAYSHEVISFGFWPGTEGAADASFFAYARPRPPGLERTRFRAPGASFVDAYSGFVLPYESVRATDDPRATVLDFYQQLYDTAATLGGWDRAALDREEAFWNRARDPQLVHAHAEP